MKKILKLLFLSLFIITISSCDDDTELLTISAKGSGEITAPDSGFSQILNPIENQTNIALTLTWNPADYGLPTEITYIVEFAKSGTDFATPFLAGTTTDNHLAWNISELNEAAISVGLLPFTEGSMDVRVIATVGIESIPQTSGLITVNITPFTTDLPKIAVPEKHQGWDPPTAPLLAASGFGETNYEGYVWLTIEGDEGFKFLAPNDTGEFEWGNTDWGDDGSFTGILVEQDEVNCKVDADGYYLVKANTDALTYSTTAVSWGIIGAATPTGWDSDTDMTYDADSRTLYIDIDLVPGPFKFRANDDWPIQFGSFNDDGYLKPDGDLTFDGAAGNYRVVLDLSNPREYTFSITAN